MAEDRTGHKLFLTHEFLSMMLGVGRSGVTTALNELKKKGLISNERASISIIEREALEKHSAGTYRRAFEG